MSPPKLMSNTSAPTGLPTNLSDTSASQRASYAYFALVVLTLLNLLNYVDPFIFAALIPYLKDDPSAHYTDAQLGWIGSAFTYVYLFVRRFSVIWAIVIGAGG